MNRPPNRLSREALGILSFIAGAMMVLTLSLVMDDLVGPPHCQHNLEITE